MKMKQRKKPKQTKGCASAMSSNGRERGHLPAYGTERWELQFCGVFVVIVITGHRGRLLDAVVTTAAAAFHKGPTEGFAETEK